MKLDPGYYKIQKRGSFLGGSRNHYLRVFYVGKVKYFQFDHGLPEEVRDREDYIFMDYTLVKKIKKPIEINSPKITITWRDEDQDEFQFKANDLQILNKFFKDFPRLKKALSVE